MSVVTEKMLTIAVDTAMRERRVNPCVSDLDAMRAALEAAFAAMEAPALPTREALARVISKTYLSRDCPEWANQADRWHILADLVHGMLRQRAATLPHATRSCMDLSGQIRKMLTNNIASLGVDGAVGIAADYAQAQFDGQYERANAQSNRLEEFADWDESVGDWVPKRQPPQPAEPESGGDARLPMFTWAQVRELQAERDQLKRKLDANAGDLSALCRDRDELCAERDQLKRELENARGLLALDEAAARSGGWDGVKEALPTFFERMLSQRTPSSASWRQNASSRSKAARFLRRWHRRKSLLRWHGRRLRRRRWRRCGRRSRWPSANWRRFTRRRGRCATSRSSSGCRTFAGRY